MRRWILIAVVVFAVLDVVVLAVGYRARAGVLPSWQLEQPRFTEEPAPDDSGTETTSPEDAISGPVLLAVDSTGLVLRATRGACEPRFDNPATIAVGSVRSGDGLTTVVVPDVMEVLGVSVLPDSHLRVSGLDEHCKVVNVDSTDDGQTWTRLASAGIWRLDIDTTADHVTGPAGKVVPVGCIPRQLLNLPARALASCDGGAFYVLATTGKPVPMSVSGYSSLSVALGPGPGDFYALGMTSDCGAQVGSVVRTRLSVGKLACLEVGKAPLAIASAGTLIVAQVGDDLLASEDGGRTFDVVG